MISENEAVEILSLGELDAEDLINEADAKFKSRFTEIDKSMAKLIHDVKKHFPDATYYTASGGFHLMLGNPHDDNGYPQQDLVAFSGKTSIQDGDF